MDTTETAPSAQPRPITWPIWFAWVLVCALVPVLSTIAATAFGKQISPNAQHPVLLMFGLLALSACAVLSPPVMQWLVLKRTFERLDLILWLFGIALATIAWTILTQYSRGHGLALVEAGFRTQFQLQRAASPDRLAGTLNAMHILRLPWRPFLLWTIATSALTSLAPAWALGVSSGLRRTVWVFLAASIVGSLVSAIVEQIYLMTLGHGLLDHWALNGISWTGRVEVLARRSGVGAVWGATTAIFVVQMTRQTRSPGSSKGSILAIDRTGGLALVLMAPLLIAAMAPFVGYLAGPRGIVAGAPELRRTLSLAPSRDVSRGETVLTYSHDVVVPVVQMSPAIAPDGRSAIVRTPSHTLVQIDLATGRTVRQLAGPLAPLERYAIVWSPDGRYLALRSNGSELSVPNTHSKQRQNRVRLYAWPEMTLAGELPNSGDACFETYMNEPMLFSDDSKSLWLVCGQHTASRPEDPMAMRLDVPAMQVLDVRRYGEGVGSGPIRGLRRIGNSVWTWQFSSGGKPFRIRDLTHEREITTVPMPMDLIGELTPQNSEIDEATVRLNFCGAPPGAPADAGPGSWICRTLTFDTQSGAMIGSVDKADHRVPNPALGQPMGILSGHGLRIESFWREDDKAGELVVRDGPTGRERQRILSIAQRPIQMSVDGVWLMTGSVYGNSLRLYRIRQ